MADGNKERAQSKNLITLFAHPKVQYRLEQIREIMHIIGSLPFGGQFYNYFTTRGGQTPPRTPRPTTDDREGMPGIDPDIVQGLDQTVHQGRDRGVEGPESYNPALRKLFQGEPQFSTALCCNFNKSSLLFFYE
jgi:hypothetical protein